MRDYTLQGLMKRRAELDAEAIAIRKRLEYLETALARVDAAIGVFDAEMDPTGIRPRRHRGPNSVRPGEWSRAVLDVLRRAEGLISTADVAEGVMVARGADPQDAAARRMVTKRVVHALGHHRRRGWARSEQGSDQAVLWRVAL